MKITVSQQDKKISVEFHHPKPLLGKEGKGRLVVDKFVIDKAEDFLGVVDRLVKKRKMKVESLQKASLEFSAQGGPASGWKNTGMLTERVVRAIMLGLKFSYFKQN